MLLVGCSYADAKTLDAIPPKMHLRDGDSFSVECKNVNTGVIDRESVNVDAATVTIEIPGSAPVVHKITQFSVAYDMNADRFGAMDVNAHLQLALWGETASRQGIGLVNSGHRWMSQHDDDSYWNCANY
jgi:hypothetical protein